MFACNDLTMSVAGHQTLRVLDGSYALDRPADVTEVIPRADVPAVVFGPDGSTVMRRDDTGEDAWSALWNGDEPHDVHVMRPVSAAHPVGGGLSGCCVAGRRAGRYGRRAVRSTGRLSSFPPTGPIASRCHVGRSRRNLPMAQITPPSSAHWHEYLERLASL
jgi:hypothetical protein